MERVDHVTAAPGDLFTEGDPGTGTQATVVTADWLNGVQEELVSIIEAAGITPDKATLDQFWAALSKLRYYTEAISAGKTVEIGKTYLVDATSGILELQLPDPAGRGFVFVRDHLGTFDRTHGVKFKRDAAESIEGAAADYTYLVPKGSIGIFSDGTNWYLFGERQSSTLSDFSQVKTVGTVGQQAAGHIWNLNEPGSTGAEALWLMENTGALLTDSSGNGYTLTNNNVVVAADGILGAGYGAQFNGVNQSLSHATFLDTVLSSIAMELWFRADDGQPGSAERIIDKANVGGQDFLELNLETDGALRILTEEGNNGNRELLSSIRLPNGLSEWVHLVFGWDTTFGRRLWINGVLEAVDGAAGGKVLMGNGTASDFTIGSAAGGAAAFAGRVGMFRVREKVLTQEDVDQAFSTFYTLPAHLRATRDLEVRAAYKRFGTDAFEREFDFKGLQVSRGNDGLYRAGGIITGLQSDDYLKVSAKAA